MVHRWGVHRARVHGNDGEGGGGIRKKPRGADLMVVGDFNADIAVPEGNRRAENIATDIATEGL